MRTLATMMTAFVLAFTTIEYADAAPSANPPQEKEEITLQNMFQLQMLMHQFSKISDEISLNFSKLKGSVPTENDLQFARTEILKIPEGARARKK